MEDLDPDLETAIGMAHVGPVVLDVGAGAGDADPGTGALSAGAAPAGGDARAGESGTAESGAHLRGTLRSQHSRGGSGPGPLRRSGHLSGRGGLRAHPGGRHDPVGGAAVQPRRDGATIPQQPPRALFRHRPRHHGRLAADSDRLRARPRHGPRAPQRRHRWHHARARTSEARSPRLPPFADQHTSSR